MANSADNPAAGGPVLRTRAFDAAVFDLDGVVTQTATVHAAAWKALFDAFLERHAAGTGEAFRPFDAETDYRRYVDGKPRYDGVRSFLESRGIVLPDGEPDDPPERETVCGLGNRKNRFFHERLARDGVKVFDSSVVLIRELRARGLRIGLVSSSKNAAAVLAAAGLTDLFDIRVDGVEAARLGLKGKPDPDIFLHAADVLGVAPPRAIGVEDALAGVEAIRSAGFGLVVGVDRTGRQAALIEHGADIVVRDLAELQLLSDPRDHRDLPDALERYAGIARRIVARQPAIFLDYDGTLTPIVARPDLAVMAEEMRDVVRELAALCPVAIVSGRDRADVARLVGLDTLVYAGSHGFDIAGPGGLRKQHKQAAAFLPALDRAEGQLREPVGGIAGALVERKRFAIAVHYRLVADESRVGRVGNVVDTVLRANPELRRTYGKKVFELRPRLDWDKGRAVLWLLTALGLDGPEILPIYIGDDDTDEDAFVALADRGIGILVADGPQATAAQCRLKDPDAVGRFLRAVVATLRERRTP